MSNSSSGRRLHAIFSGRVQGVGFRWTVCRLAEQFKVTGYVQNLWNGDVELVVEGAEDELIELLNEIRGSRPGQNISREQIRWKGATGEYNRFGILFE